MARKYSFTSHGLGFKTYRVGKRTGRTYPLYFLIEGALQTPRMTYISNDTISYEYTTTGSSAIIPKFTVESGVHKKISERFTYNLLFYAGAEFFWLQNNLAPQPSLGVKFQPVFRNSLTKTN